MKKLFAIILALALLLCGAAALAKESSVGPFLGNWKSGNIRVDIRMEGEALRCCALRSDEGERDLLEYSLCRYDEEAGCLQCMGAIYSHEVYYGLFDEWSEMDWAMDDMRTGAFELSRDGAALVWTDDGLKAPVELARSDD